MGQRSDRRSGVETVEPGGVGAGDLELVLGAGILEVARDDLLRMRPGRSLVRVVGRLHHLVDTDEMAAGDADKVVDVGRPHLALEVLARLQLIGEAGGDPLALEGAVHALQIIGQPADIVLGRDDLQLGEAVELMRESGADRAPRSTALPRPWMSSDIRPISRRKIRKIKKWMQLMLSYNCTKNIKYYMRCFVLFSLIFFAFQLNAQPVKQHGALHVNGVQLVDSHDKPVVLRGMSFGWSCFHPRFYTAGSVQNPQVCQVQVFPVESV